MKTKNEAVDYKLFNLRLPKETWAYLKNFSTKHETSMCDIVLTLIDKHKKKNEHKLT